MTRTTLILLAGVGAAALTACGRDWTRDDGEPMRPMRAVSQLQCPDHEGSLTRVQVAPDGLSCDYAGPRGAEVVLKLVKPANGDTTAVLDDLDTQMNALMPEVQGKVDQGEAELRAEDSAPSGSSAEARDRVDINLPGFHIHTRGNHAEVRLPGVNIDADDDKHADGGSSHGNAHVAIGGDLVDVRAHNDAAIIHVRSRGRGVRAGYRLVDKTPSPQGWRLAGYDAHGPAGGPLVVAVVKSKDSEEDPLFHDAQHLVRANVGG
jgi:Cu/Zn superoxide dismutase